MKQMALHFRLYLKNWQLLLFAFFPGVALTVPALLTLHYRSEPNLMLTLLGTAGIAGGAAFFLGTAQQEMLSRSFTFLLPGLRGNMVRQNLVAVALLAVLVVVSVLVFPIYRIAGHALAVLALCTAGLAVLTYSLILLVLLVSPFSAFFWFQAFWFGFFLIRFLLKIDPAAAVAFLDKPFLWLPLAVAACSAAMARLGGANLHRRLVERPFFSIVDMKNTRKMEAYKHARRKHKNALEKEGRPWGAVIRACLDRAAQSAARTRHVSALLWESWAAMLMVSIPRRRLWHMGLVLMILTFIVWLGYWDAWIARDPEDQGLVGWFPGLVFMAAFFSLPGFHFIKTRPLGLLHCRPAMFRAGLLSAALTLVQTLALAGLLYGVFVLGRLFLPAVEWRGCLLEFRLPAWHTPLLPFFFLPAQFLVHTLWPVRGSMQVMGQAGTISFFVFHALLTFGQGALLGWVVLAAALLWMALVPVWRWRVMRTDLA